MESGQVIEVVIRRATMDDYGALLFFADCILRRDYFLRSGQLTEILAASRHEMWVAVEGTWLVAMAIMTRGDRMVNILVHPSYRGVGLGRALVEATKATSVRVKLDSMAGDPTRFYERLGFVRLAEESGRANVRVMGKAGIRPGQDASRA